MAVSIKIVEFLKELEADGRVFRPGTRLPAWKTKDGWMLIFNGTEIPAPKGVVGEIESPAVQAAVEQRSAREEEYQSAPSTTWNTPEEPPQPPDPPQ